MNNFVRLSLPVLVLALAGCTGMGRSTVSQSQPVITAPQPTYTAPALPSPSQTTQAALQTTSVSSDFIDPAVVPLMTAKDSAEANSAQFYALQFGRPGAPRNWTGDKGTTGSVSVGPYVRVNNLDCREFTHTVKLGGTDYVRKGTACREVAGNWSVVSGAA
jgi:surface antigen